MQSVANVLWSRCHFCRCRMVRKYSFENLLQNWSETCWTNHQPRRGWQSPLPTATGWRPEEALIFKKCFGVSGRSLSTSKVTGVRGRELTIDSASFKKVRNWSSFISLSFERATNARRTECINRSQTPPGSARSSPCWPMPCLSFKKWNTPWTLLAVPSQSNDCFCAPFVVIPSRPRSSTSPCSKQGRPLMRPGWIRGGQSDVFCDTFWWWPKNYRVYVWLSTFSQVSSNCPKSWQQTSPRIPRLRVVWTMSYPIAVAIRRLLLSSCHRRQG